MPARLVDGDDQDREADFGQRRVAHALIVVYFNCNEVFVFDVFSIAAWLELAEKVSLLGRQGNHHPILLLVLRDLVPDGHQIKGKDLLVDCDLVCCKALVVILDQRDRLPKLPRAKEKKVADEGDILFKSDRDASRWNVASGVVDPDFCIETFNG